MGIVLFLLYIAAGCALGLALRPHKDPIVSGWLGCVLGLTASAWFPVLWALLTGKLNVFSTLAGFLTMLIPCAVVVPLLCRKKRPVYAPISRKQLYSLLAFVVPFSLLEAILFLGHVLCVKNGILYGGQSTYGDLSMHLGMITSMAEQGTFPPEYSIYPGLQMGYPFLVNALSAWIMILGNSLRASVVVPSIVMCTLLFTGFWLWFRETSKSRRTATLACLLFFLAGGLGVFYFLDGSRSDTWNFTRIFTEFYNTPTNFPEDGLRWTNVLCDMILPQRTTMLGWTMIPAALFLMDTALKEKSRKCMLLSGILAGAMPMMHTHSFVGVGIIGIGWALTRWPWKEGPRVWLSYIREWLFFIVPVLILALPQLWTWTFSQSSAEGFIRLEPLWVNDGDPVLWFWVKNLGIPFVLLLPALMAGRKKYLAWYSGAIVIFIVAQIVVFQPNPYDNNKLLCVWWMLSVVPVAEYMRLLVKKIRSVPGGRLIAFAAACVIFASGVFTVFREIFSSGQYQLYTEADLEVAAYVEENTEADTLFITGTQHLNPVAALTGRNIYTGCDSYLYYHGIDTTARREQLQAIYTDTEAAASLPAELGAEYIMVSDHERNDYPGCEELLDSLYPRAFVSENGRIVLYRVS